MNFDLDTTKGMGNAITWTKALILTINDRGAWMIPRSGTIVRVNKAQRIATIAEGVYPDTAIKRVFEAMGWTVIEK